MLLLWDATTPHPPRLGLAPGDCTSCGAPTFLAHLGEYEVQLGVIKASMEDPEAPQGGDPDPLLTSLPDYCPCSTDKKVEVQRGDHTGAQEDTKSQGSDWSPLQPPWACNKTPGRN